MLCWHGGESRKQEAEGYRRRIVVCSFYPNGNFKNNADVGLISTKSPTDLITRLTEYIAQKVPMLPFYRSGPLPRKGYPKACKGYAGLCDSENLPARYRERHLYLACTGNFCIIKLCLKFLQITYFICVEDFQCDDSHYTTERLGAH